MKKDQSTSEPKNILIVEDNPDIRHMIKMALEFRGYKVFEAENGQEGIELLPKIKKPCLILLDLMMPVMNGWEFVEALQENVTLATIPVVVVTAYSEKASNLSDKTNGLLKKPVNLNQLYSSVDAWCSECGQSKKVES